MKSHHKIFAIFLIIVVLGTIYYIASSGIVGDALSKLGIHFNQKKAPAILISAYSGSVRLYFISAKSVADNNNYVTIKAFLPKDQYVDVTGWTLKSGLGSFVIPQAKDFNTAKGVLGDIFLKNGSALSLYAGDSPVGGNARTGELDWGVWYGRLFDGFPHDTLTLYDKDGKLVAKRSY